MNPVTVTFRREDPADEHEVDALIREAFWNQYVPGCTEHYVAHVLRQSPVFVPELAILAEADGRIIGSILYTRAQILLDAGGELPVLTFGPIAVLPDYQGVGVGGLLIRHTQDLARDAGGNAVLIYGDPAYYGRFGFVPAEKFGIGTEDDLYRSSLLAFELREGALADAAGRFVESAAFAVNEAAAAEFDRGFPPMEKKAGIASQERFQELLQMRRPRKG
jgi:predicted N-acetyltransferase YhbS